MKPKVSPKMKLIVVFDWLVDNAIPGDDDRTFVLDKVVSFLKVSSDVDDGKQHCSISSFDSLHY